MVGKQAWASAITDSARHCVLQVAFIVRSHGIIGLKSERLLTKTVLLQTRTMLLVTKSVLDLTKSKFFLTKSVLL